jgi:predicted phosphodiesterase
MRLLISGDSHADRNHVKSIRSHVEKFECDAAYVVGDYGFWPRDKGGLKFLNDVAQLDFPVYFTAGNHEDWDYLDKHLDNATRFGTRTADGFVEVHTNSFYAPTGLSWVWDDMKFLSVGGAFSIDRKRRVKFIDWFPQEIITEEDVSNCMNAGKVDVILAHDVPMNVDITLPFVQEYGTGVELDPDTLLNRHRLQVIVDMVDPQLLVHGHWHMSYTQQVQDMKVVGLHCNANPGNLTVIDTEDLK